MLSASVLVVLLSFIFAGKAAEFKPTSVTFSSTSETVTVKWKDPTDGPAYLYEVSIVGGDLDQTELLYSNVYEHTFSEGILPSTTYSVKVFAYSLTGNIGFEHDTVETWPGIPGMPIIDEFGFKAEEDKSAISLSWSKPELNGNLETYVLTAFSEGNITKNTTSELRTTLLGPLGNGLYFVELYAVTKPNNNGKGGGRGPTNRIGPINIPPIQRNVDLILSQITMGTIRLQWDFSSINANCGIYSNTIYYNDGNHTHKEILIPASHQYIVKNLALNVQYTFIVSADCVGSTVALTKEVKLTPEEYPPSMPQNVKANVTENSIKVSWSPPASPNGKLGAYRVSIEGETTESKEEEGLTTSFEGLKSLTTYTVAVKAQTTAGYGPAAVITVTTLPNVKDLPKVPKNLQATLKSPTAALVTWEEPEESSLPVTDYLLSFRQPGGNWESVKIYGNTLKHFLTGLQPSSAYELELCAVSQLIKGEPAKTNLSTLVVVPSLPSNLRATQTSADKVSITWDLPASARAEDGVELLLVKSFKGGILQATSTEPTSSGVLPVTGIEPNTVMSFTAQAIRPGPLGGFSEVKQLPDLITWPELPAPPSDLKLQATGQNSLRASWAESSDRALVLKYQITVTADGIRSTETLETTGTEISVENLEIYTDYSVEVAAVGKPNQNGEGSVAGNATKGNVKTWPGPGGIPSDVQGDADEKKHYGHLEAARRTSYGRSKLL
uniref:Tyrosine-protein phosphatase Lar n=1 Tax=Schistocephalus solidus TaxID=70667 RepID=A0A0X3PJ04_SCHSO